MDCGVGMGVHSSVQLENPEWGARCCKVVPGDMTQGSVELEQETGKTDYTNKCIRGVEYNGFSHLLKKKNRQHNTYWSPV